MYRWSACWFIRMSSVAVVTAPPRAVFDRALLLVVPAAAFMLLLFVYPFLYGLALSFNPKEGGALANYWHFFTTDNLWPTIWTTLRLALPATLINVAGSASRSVVQIVGHRLSVVKKCE